MRFLIQMLTGEAGRVSSKRGVMVFFVLLYSFTLLYNMFTGKAPAPIYQEQLFELVIISLVAVFGEKVLSAIPAVRGKKNELPKTQQP